MTDDLEKLRAALKAAQPAIEPDAKARATRMALENFDKFHESRQGSAAPARPMSDRPAGTGFLTGVRTMLSNLTTRPALAATASVAALAVGMFVVVPMLDKAPLPKPGPMPVTTEGTVEPVVEETTTESRADKAEATDLARTQQPAPATPDRERTEALVAPSGSVTQDGGVQLNGDGSYGMPYTGAENESAGDDEADDGLGFGLATADQTAPSEAEPRVDAEPIIPMMEAAPSASIAQGRAADGLFLGGTVAAPTDIAPPPQPDTEAFANEDTNPVKLVAEEPVSTFSIDVDTASYAVVRSSLMNGSLPPPEAVRIEEMVNYFPYAYPAPEADEAPFKPTVTLLPAPWNAGKTLVHIGIQGQLPAVEDRPPLNLVFLIDTSGSMEDPNKLPLLKQSFRLMLGELRPEDQVAIVTYAGSAGQVLEPTAAAESAKILSALDRLDAGGSTAGQEGLQQAYSVAEGMAGDGEVTRVILATDGDFNVGIHDPEQLKTYIEGKRESGTYLSVLGFGRGNLDDATMQALAQNGNGTAAYIDTLSEAQKVLVDNLTGALFPIANDVKIQMEFNPAVIQEYRLIGYETRALAREDFNNDKVDAGDIGAGHTVTAIYEVTPVGSPAVLNDPLRYVEGEAAPAQADADAELGFLKLRYKEPGESVSKLIEVPVGQAEGTPNDDVRFATAIAGFGQLLSGDKYLGNWGWNDAIALANGAKGADEFGYRAEAVQLMRLGESLSR